MMFKWWTFVIMTLRSVVTNDQENSVTNEQSAPCTPQESLRQIQCLRELPAEKYEVSEGEDVLMRCRVAHQRGKVQWRAGNFLLGYIRAIPSRPRYSIQGDARLGVHDLLIRNVTNNDAGTFECQVSPAEGQSALRRTTALSILVQPSQPIIIGASGDAQPTTSGQLIVPIPQESSSEKSSQNQLRLFCQVKGGVPPPTFEWFHNGLLVPGNPMTNSSDFYEDGYTSLSDARFPAEVYTAELVLDKANLKTGDRLACLVSNKATLRSKQLSKQKLRSELFVAIHSAPGDPELIGLHQRGNQSAVYDSGASLDFTCRSIPAGNPPGELSWRMERMRRSAQMDTAAPFSHASGGVGEYLHKIYLIPPESVIYQYTDDKLLSKVRIPRLNASHHGLDLVCGVKNQAGPEKTVRKTILVRHSPNSVAIHGPEETLTAVKRKFVPRISSHRLAEMDRAQNRNALLYIHPDRPQYLLCLTSPYFDKAFIKWYAFLEGQLHWLEIQPMEAFQITLEDTEFSYILVSVVQLVTTNLEPNALLKWSAIKCVSEGMDHVTNLSNSSAEHVVRLKAYESPGKPLLTVHNETVILFEGQNLTLMCVASAGSPNGEIKWITSQSKADGANGSEFKTTTEIKPNNQMVSNLTLSLTKSMNGLQVQCASLNEGYEESDDRRSQPVVLYVLYAASVINMSVTDGSGRSLLSRDATNILYKSKRDSPIHLDTSQIPMVLTAEMGTTLSVTCEVDPSNPPSRIYWSLHRCEKSPLLRMLHRAPSKSEQCELTHLEARKSKILTYPSSRALSEMTLLNVLFKPIFIANGMQISEGSVHSEPTEILHLVTVEGGTFNVDLEPVANPPAHKFMWFKNDKQLTGDYPELVESANHSSPSSPKRFSTQSGKLHILPVRIEDMGNYSLLAVNTIGNARIHFFLNVTYGPRLIGKPIVNITAAGQKAVLECEAQANPSPTETAVRWRRLPYALAGIEISKHFYKQIGAEEDERVKQHELQATSVTGIRCNKGNWHSGFKYFVKCWRINPYTLTSSLTIYDLGPSDVGRYQCYMDNAVGSPAVRIIDLLYPFAPKIISIPRWLKAAPSVSLRTPAEHHHLSNSPNNNSISEANQARLTCVVGAEPMPKVEWIREPANLTLVEGGQFQSEVRIIQPGLYHAILYLIKPKEPDLGRYYCKVTNEVGQAVGKVDLIEPTKPEMPSMPRLINTTSTTMAVRWTQASNGGPKQKFHLRWAPNENPDKYKQAEIQEDLRSETLTYIIEGLQKATSYRVAVSASNHLMGSTGFTPYLLASTKAHDPIPDKEAMQDEARGKSSAGNLGEPWELTEYLAANAASYNRNTDGSSMEERKGDRTLFLIVSASIFGSLVLFANLLIILLLAHKKRKKLSRGHTMFNGHDSMIRRSRRQSFAEMIVDHQPSYAAYLDGASMSDNLYLPARSADQYSDFQTGISRPVTATEAHDLLSSKHSYLASVRPSLQMMNHLEVQTQSQMDFSPRVQLANVNITDPAMNEIAYIHSDNSPQVVDFQGHPLLQIRNPGPERNTPITGRVNANLGIYPEPHHVESPNSATASIISAARSAGYPNAHSLERQGHLLLTRQPSHHNISSLLRHPRYLQCAINDVFDRNMSDYVLRNHTSTFTPNQAIANGRIKTNPMVSSVYAERLTQGAMAVCSDDNVHGDLSSGAGAWHLMKKSSCRNYNNTQYSNQMNTSQLLDSYLQRHDDRLFNCQIATGNHAVNFAGLHANNALSADKNYVVPARPVGDSQQATESIVLPPPNRFASDANSQYFHNLARGIDAKVAKPMIREAYQSLEDEQEMNESDRHFVEHDRWDARPVTVAPVKHPTLNQSLL
ncbi:unnamed protein product [Dicrocoelium dendriticum]|nr:unnamed protein product [Dicrocoelium dendriticum]